MKKIIKLFMRIALKCLIIIMVINLCFAFLNDHPLKSYKDALEINNFTQKTDHNVSFIVFATKDLFERLLELKNEFKKSEK